MPKPGWPGLRLMVRIRLLGPGAFGGRDKFGLRLANEFHLPFSKAGIWFRGDVQFSNLRWASSSRPRRLFLVGGTCGQMEHGIQHITSTTITADDKRAFTFRTKMGKVFFSLRIPASTWSSSPLKFHEPLGWNGPRIDRNQPLSGQRRNWSWDLFLFSAVLKSNSG